MKSSKYLLICLLALNIMGCESYFGENANADPDNPGSATIFVLLPQIQVRTAYTYGGDITRYLSTFTQHIDGEGRGCVAINNYQIFPGDMNTPWSNIYSGTLNSNQVMKNLATEMGANHYLAVGLIMESFNIMVATDCWGDIPYSDAIKFQEYGGIYAPEVDTQESIYDAIFNNLDQARMLLAGDNGGVALGGDDLMYNGDVAKWAAFATALEARGRIHLCNVDNSAYSKVLAALNDGGFSEVDDAATLKFGIAATENAPWYQFISQRDDAEVGDNYVALMNALNDPRVATYGYEHSLPHPIFTKDQNVQLLSYSEQEFIRAEALVETGDPTGAYDAFVTAVTASFTEAGVSGAEDYIANNYGAAVNVSDILIEKYIALHTSPEVFSDWRRRGIPFLTPNMGTALPRRLPYPEAEQLANPNIPAPSTMSIFDNVWWDQ